MQRAVRIVDNPALDVAIEAANLLGLPVVVVYFSVIPNYPNANLRHYHFLQQGLGMSQKTRRSAAWGSLCVGIPTTRLRRFLKRRRRRC
jgi:deoxyribodipyrimidine photo-lyase